VKDVATNGMIHETISVKASNTKTKKGRTVKLNSTATKAIKAVISALNLKPNDYLFKSRKHGTHGTKAISRQQAHGILKALFNECLIFGNVSTHTMRKTFAKAIYDATGGKIELVKQALGHSSINSTLSYLSFNHQAVDDAIQGMAF
jgi:integrase